jgi:hypothetical protein
MCAPPETLLLISITVIGGSFVVTSVSATTSDLAAGHRRTDIQIFAGQAALMHRLAELAPRICPARSSTMAAA